MNNGVSVRGLASSAMRSLLPAITGTLARSFCIGAVLLFAVNSAHGQGMGTSGAIVGTVQDPSGAAVSGATIAVTSLETSVIRTTVTGADGTYDVSELPLGTYQVAVNSKGFKKAIQSPLTIAIKSRVRADFHLEVGAQTTVVHVSGGANQLLQTDTAETGGLVTRTELKSLPIITRNFLSVAATLPGSGPGQSGSRQQILNGAAVSVSGASAEANNTIIDGLSDNEEFSNAMGVVPPIDAIQEFKVQTSQYSAEFGRATGGVINIAIKSGTNDFHGFAFDYLGSDKLNATPYFDAAKPPFHSNEFGGGLGGPIRKDKLFFFGDYQGLRNNAPFQFLGIVPTALEKGGNFSESGYTVYDPNTTHPDPANPSNHIRDPFQNDTIPGDRINKISAALLAVYPLPNYTRPNFAQNYRSVLSNSHQFNSYDIKVDDDINPANVISGRVSRQTGNIGLQGFLPGQLMDATGKENGLNASLTYTHIFSPHLLNSARFGYNYSLTGNTPSNTTNFVSQFDIPNIANIPGSNGFPTVAIRNVANTQTVRPIAGLSSPFKLVENNYQVVDDVTYEKGTHSFKFGGQISKQSESRYQGLPGNSYFDFSGQYTSAAVGQSLPAGTADALLGLSDDFITEYTFDATRLFTTRAALYAQDYWRVIPKLTVSLGLRYQVNTHWHELHDRVANFDFSSGQFVLPSSTQSIVEKGIGQVPSTFKYVPANQVYPSTNLSDFAPRVGLSYALTNRIVTRAGVGIFDGVVPGNTYSNAGTIAPFLINVYNLGDNETPVDINNGFPPGGALGALSTPTLTGYYTPLHAHTPYSLKWNADIQWSPNDKSVLDVAYDGNRSMHSSFLNFMNTPTPGPGPAAPRQPYPYIGYVLGYVPVNTSKFNALEVSFTQNTFHNLTFRSAYTYAKCKSYTFGLDGGELSNPFDANYDWGPCSYSPASRWTTTFVYDFPTANGLGRPAQLLLSNWQVSGILTLQTGLPFTVTLSPDILNISGEGKNRPDVVGDPNLSSGDRSITKWFNTSAFATPALYTFGNEAANTLRGPGFSNLDLGAQKGISLTGSRMVILRMEAGNVFNHPSFGLPGSSYLGPNFGVIQSTASNPRTVQAVFRFEF